MKRSSTTRPKPAGSPERIPRFRRRYTMPERLFSCYGGDIHPDYLAALVARHHSTGTPGPRPYVGRKIGPEWEPLYRHG